MTLRIVSGNSPLVIAVPSKGRLQENATAFFARVGMPLVQGRGARDYRAALEGMEGVEVALMSAADISQQLAQGRVHFGVTGEDLLRETILDADDRVCLLTPLGFGHARVVVAAPQAWIDVRTMADLADVAAAFHASRGQRMRVATKYVNLTRKHFAANGVADYRIVESSGATEAAPSAGQAELIVDITTTGATLRANALKTLEDGLILSSQANLAASLGASWSETTLRAAQRILARIAAEEEARNTRELRVNIPNFDNSQADEAAISFCASVRGRGCEDLVLLSCPKDEAPKLAQWLIERGADSVCVRSMEYIFRAQNPLWEKLRSRLEPRLT